MSQKWLRLIPPLAVLLAGGCAYYNGVYNSKAAAHTGDRTSQTGDVGAAATQYRKSAVTAETVLARHPKTKWRPDALYLAGRGFAFGGACAEALPRLNEYLALPGQPEDKRERATIALASCLITFSAQALEADTLLAPLLRSKDAEVRGQASLWDGRAALVLGDVLRAQTLLSAAPGSSAAWEFMAAAFRRGDLAVAESLLITRAQKGDWRPEVPADVSTLWGSSRRAGAVRVVNLYGKSGAPVAERVMLHLKLSDIAAAANDTALARLQAIEAMRVGITPAVEADARVRMLALRIRELDALADVEAAIRRDSARVQGTALIKSLTDDVLLVHFCLNGQNVGGVGVFLAAEIARDSLHANRLSMQMFRSIERDIPESEIAGRGLLASALMFPESTQVFRARVLANWPTSGAAAAVHGADPSFSSASNEDRALGRAWTAVMTRWDSVLKARKTADSLATIKGTGRQ